MTNPASGDSKQSLSPLNRTGKNPKGEKVRHMDKNTPPHSETDPAEKPKVRDFTRIGFFLFFGLMAGAVIGGFGFYAPVFGALTGAAIGLAAALFLDLRALKKQK